jgi:ParB-like chromosome segregation protein Spo0J
MPKKLKPILPKLVKISELKATKYNPRKITRHQMKSLAKSIEKNGFLENILNYAKKTL